MGRNNTPLSIDYREMAAQPDFHTGCEGIVTHMPNGDEVRWHIGNNGWFYINGEAFGVGGMPPALHASTHIMGGEDAIDPESMGAISLTRIISLEEENPTPLSGMVAVTANDGRIPSELVNLDSLPTLEDFLQLKADFEALKSMVIMSENIALLNSVVLPDGVASLELIEK